MSLYNSEHQKLSGTPKDKEKAEAEPTKKVEEKESGQVEPGAGEKKIEKADVSKKVEGKESAAVEKKKDKGATPQKAGGKEPKTAKKKQDEKKDVKK